MMNFRFSPPPDRPTPVEHGQLHFVSHRPLDPPFPQGAARVLLGMGCFWGAERKFWQAGEGVYVTAVGYAGGATRNPTYQDVCTGRTGHAEVVMVVFDPKTLPFARVLQLFWESHDPTQGMRQGNDVGTQYRSAIFAEFGSAARRGARLPRRLSAGAERARLWRDHHGNRLGAALLLRRGISPAISRQEPRRLLRSGRHGRRLPCGAYAVLTARPIRPVRPRRFLCRSPRGLHRRAALALWCANEWT